MLHAHSSWLYSWDEFFFLNNKVCKGFYFAGDWCFLTMWPGLLYLSVCYGCLTVLSARWNLLQMMFLIVSLVFSVNLIKLTHFYFVCFSVCWFFFACLSPKLFFFVFHLMYFPSTFVRFVNCMEFWTFLIKISAF